MGMEIKIRCHIVQRKRKTRYLMTSGEVWISRRLEVCCIACVALRPHISGRVRWDCRFFPHSLTHLLPHALRTRSTLWIYQHVECDTLPKSSYSPHYSFLSFLLPFPLRLLHVLFFSPTASLSSSTPQPLSLLPYPSVLLSLAFCGLVCLLTLLFLALSIHTFSLCFILLSLLLRLRLAPCTPRGQVIPLLFCRCSC